jgi:hypothetical protein
MHLNSRRDVRKKKGRKKIDHSRTASYVFYKAGSGEFERNESRISHV